MVAGLRPNCNYGRKLKMKNAEERNATKMQTKRDHFTGAVSVNEMPVAN